MTQATISLERGHRQWGAALTRTAGFVAVGVVGVSGVLIALDTAAGEDGYLVPALRRAVADFITGPLASYGATPQLHVFFTEVLVMTAAYAAAVVCATRISLWWIAAVVVVLHVAFLLAPPLLSNDIFNYIDVARLGGLYHLDPYVATPAAQRHDG